MTTLSKPDPDATVPTHRMVIARELGANEMTETPLGKPAFNQLHAYLTGEFACRPGYVYHAPSPGLQEIKEDVATQVGLVTGRTMDSYFDHIEYAGRDRHWRKDELRRTIDAMIKRGDQRDWANGAEQRELA